MGSYLLAITLIIITVAWLISCVTVLSLLTVIIIDVDMDLEDLLNLARVLVQVVVNPLPILITQLQPQTASSDLVANHKTVKSNNIAAESLCAFHQLRMVKEATLLVSMQAKSSFAEAQQTAVLSLSTLRFRY